MTTPYPDDPPQPDQHARNRRVLDVVALAAMAVGAVLVLSGAALAGIPALLFVSGLAVLAAGLLIGYDRNRE